MDDFAAGALMSKDVTAEAGARMIRVSDETLDSFIALRRKALNREYGSRRLEDLTRFERALSQALSEGLQSPEATLGQGRLLLQLGLLGVQDRFQGHRLLPGGQKLLDGRQSKAHVPQGCDASGGGKLVLAVIAVARYGVCLCRKQQAHLVVAAEHPDTHPR